MKISIQNTKIFVGSLPARTNPEDLRHLFQDYGVVTECDVMNRCGFVHMETADMATNAIKALNNSQFKGQNIVVEPGRMKDRSRGGSGRGGIGSHRSDGGDRGFNKDDGNRSYNQGGPMRRDRNMQSNRNSGPYQNRSSDGQGGGSRFGNGKWFLKTIQLQNQ